MSKIEHDTDDETDEQLNARIARLESEAERLDKIFREAKGEAVRPAYDAWVSTKEVLQWAKGDRSRREAEKSPSPIK